MFLTLSLVISQRLVLLLCICMDFLGLWHLFSAFFLVFAFSFACLWYSKISELFINIYGFVFYGLHTSVCAKRKGFVYSITGISGKNSLQILMIATALPIKLNLHFSKRQSTKSNTPWLTMIVHPLNVQFLHLVKSNFMSWFSKVFPSTHIIS